MNNNLASSHPWICGSGLYRARLIEFNYHPAAWARADRLGRLCPMVADVNRLRLNPRAERFVSRFILSTWQLPEPYIFDFQSPEHRLVLVSADPLEQLAERLGLLAYSDVIRLCVRRDERARIAEAIGEPCRQYALAAAVRYGSALNGAACRPEDLSLDLVRSAGWRCVLACARSAAPAALRRFELKLPLGVELDMDVNRSGSTAWPLVERVLKSEFRGEWEACCC